MFRNTTKREEIQVKEDIKLQSGNIIVGLADNAHELQKAQKLRYDMLVLDYDDSKDKDGTDASDYDDFCDHLIAVDTSTGEVVGTYRLMNNSHLKYKNRFICEGEFDITRLKTSGENILELGRAVVDKNYRNGVVIKLLWQGLFAYCKLKNIRFMFGTGSFHGTDPSIYTHAFASLYYNHKVDDKYDCFANPPCERMDIITESDVDPIIAKQTIPPLIKGYIMLGSKVGSGVYIDHDFNSTDVMLIFDLNDLNKAYAKRMFGVEL